MAARGRLLDADRQLMSRFVRLALFSNAGEALGTLPGLRVESPWWSEVGPVVDATRRTFGVDVVVLRLRSAVSATPMAGGDLTYEVELMGELPAELALDSVVVDRPSGDEPLRAAWARPGGVAATIAWADTVLAAAGRPRTGPFLQVKSWNLSSVLRLPTALGDVWCKTVPPFMVSEGQILAIVATEDATIGPRVFGSDRASSTVLLGHVPGEDQYEAPEARLIEMVQRLVRLQTRFAGRVGDLLAAGLPDWRAQSLPARFGAFLARPEVRALLGHAELATLDGLIAELPRRLDAIAACGLPETLVHGDFHPGNWRFGDNGLVLLDWGDCGVGHPLLDLAGTFLGMVPTEIRGHVRQAWLDAWGAACPSADPARAADLIGPIAALRGAMVYQGFLDHIEPSERPYHEADVPACLRRAVADVRDGH
jgi:hypothetical protein